MTRQIYKYLAPHCDPDVIYYLPPVVSALEQHADRALVPGRLSASPTEGEMVTAQKIEAFKEFAVEPGTPLHDLVVGGQHRLKFHRCR